MDTKELLDQLLHAAKEYTEKGQAIVEDKLDIPAKGEARQAKLDGIKNGAVIAAAAALLLGTKTGRSVTGTAIKLGSLAAVGGLAYQTYQSWKNNGDSNNETSTIESTNEKPDAAKSLTLLKAIISAAKADGHISDAELETIRTELSKLKLDLDINMLIQDISADPGVIAAQVDTVEFAAEVYLVSSLMLDHSNEAAKSYLDALIAALQLPDEIIQALDNSK